MSFDHIRHHWIVSYRWQILWVDGTSGPTRQCSGVGSLFQHTPFMLSSATLSTESLERIKVSLGIDREEVLVLSSSCDRPNVYQQSRRLHRRVDVLYVEYDFRKRDLHFILAGTSTRT